MKLKLTLLPGLFAALIAASAHTAHAAPSVFDLAGAWESTVEFGKFKFQMIVRISEAPERKIMARIDIPAQGAKDLPVNALLYNFPAVRWEIDQFGTAFVGNVNDSATEIAGVFEEGPGGRPIPLVFKRFIEKPEPIRIYAFTPGEARDIRGYWVGWVESQPGMSNRVGLKIGRLPDASFAAALDLLDQGAADLPASPVTATNGMARLDWQLLQVSFEATLDKEGTRLTGDWKQRGRTALVSFERLEQPATVLPANVSFIPDADAPADIRGHWHGTLDIPGQGPRPGNKLRIILKLGQTPDGAFAGTLGSPDQGGGEIPITSVGYTNPVVQVECKGIRGVFTGNLNADGTVMDGTWRQGPMPLALKLARSSAPVEGKP